MTHREVMLITAVIFLSILPNGFCQDEPAEPVPGDRQIEMFNCQRPGAGCQGDVNATVCNDDGTCTCEAGLDGFDCGVNTTRTLDDSECSCQNEGVCTSADDDTPSCYCGNSAYFGESCDQERVFQQCEVDSVEMRITPFSNDGTPFAGLIFITDQSSDPACVFVDDGTGTFALTLGFDACGGAENTTTVAGDVMWQFVIIVQYDDLLITANDQQFTFNCIVKQTDSLVPDQGNTGISTDEQDPGLEEQEVTQEVLPVDVSLVHAADDSPITGPVRIGTLLKLVMVLQGGSVYDSFRLESLLCHNGQETESINFVTDSCVTEVAGPAGKKIVTDFSGDVTTSMSLTFRLFRFRSTYQLDFKLVFKLCKGTGGCNATDCTSFTGLGRRRRSIEDSATLNFHPHSFLNSQPTEEIPATALIHRPTDLPAGSPDHFQNLDSRIHVIVLPTSASPNTDITQFREVQTKPDIGSCLQSASLVVVMVMVALLGAGLGSAFIMCTTCKNRQMSQKQVSV